MTLSFRFPPARATAWHTARRWLQKTWRWLLGVLGLVLAWQALRGLSWAEAGHLLAGISPIAITVILGLNLLLLPVMTARWCLLLRALDSPIHILQACAYRVAANAISYLTPGPPCGGEPLCVYVLRHRHRIPLACATASVAVDRLLEFTASCGVLTFALITLAFSEHDPFTGRKTLPVAILTLVLCFFAFFVLRGRRLPFDRAEAGSLLAGHPRRLLLVAFFSLAHWLGVFAEFWIMSAALGFHLSFQNLIAVVVTARLAFFTPMPAGIGVLESALPWLTASLGLGSALGLGLCVVIRSRDLLFSLVGLGLTMKYLTSQEKTSIISDIPQKYEGHS